MMPSQGSYHRQNEADIIADIDAIVAVGAAPTNRSASIVATNQTNNFSAISVSMDRNAGNSPDYLQSKQPTIVGGSIGGRGRDGDVDSLLEVVSARTNSRVPLLLGWAQLVLGLIGCAIGLSDAGYRSGNGGADGLDFNDDGSGGIRNNGTLIGGRAVVMVFHVPRMARPFDVTAAFGFPLWCSVSMIISSILALWYSKTSLQRLLYLYRLYSLLNLGLLCLGLILLVVSWVSQSHPGSGPAGTANWPIRLLQALNAVLLIVSWLLVLACVLCDFCIGKNLLQVLGIFVSTVCRKSQRDSFSELKRSNNSLNHPACHYKRGIASIGVGGVSGVVGNSGSGSRPLLKLVMLRSSSPTNSSDDCQSEEEIF